MSVSTSILFLQAFYTLSNGNVINIKSRLESEYFIDPFREIWIVTVVRQSIGAECNQAQSLIIIRNSISFFSTQFYGVSCFLVSWIWRYAYDLARSKPLIILTAPFADIDSKKKSIYLLHFHKRRAVESNWFLFGAWTKTYVSPGKVLTWLMLQPHLESHLKCQSPFSILVTAAATTRWWCYLAYTCGGCHHYRNITTSENHVVTFLKK